MDYNTAKATVRRLRGQTVGIVLSNGNTLNIVVKDTTSTWFKGELLVVPDGLESPADVQIDFSHIIAIVIPRPASPDLASA